MDGLIAEIGSRQNVFEIFRDLDQILDEIFLRDDTFWESRSRSRSNIFTGIYVKASVEISNEKQPTENWTASFL